MVTSHVSKGDSHFDLACVRHSAVALYMENDDLLSLFFLSYSRSTYYSEKSLLNDLVVSRIYYHNLQTYIAILQSAIFPHSEIL